MDDVSQSAVSRMKKRVFKNVEVKKGGSTFSKCSECNELKEFIAAAAKGSPEAVYHQRLYDAHVAHQQSCRRLYYSWRSESEMSQAEVLCIIHDGMDSRKTALPRLRVITKGTAGLGQLPVTLTGMVTHGHGDGAYADFSTDLWPRDSNFTISSLARCLRKLERPAIRNSKNLFDEPPLNRFFEKLMRGKSRCVGAIPEATADADHVDPLPKRLYLQLDNSAKDNKNQFVFAFLSLLTARKVFVEIQVGFLMVGHTHEDIDGYFSYVSNVLRRSNTFVLADLMKHFMESQKLSFMPHVVQEVADFKSYIKGYVRPLEGIKDKHIFRFFVDSDGWPVFQYKESATDGVWLPRAGPHRMWKEDPYGQPLLPTGTPPTLHSVARTDWRVLSVCRVMRGQLLA
jgi:hypothetical protein